METLIIGIWKKACPLLYCLVLPVGAGAPGLDPNIMQTPIWNCGDDAENDIRWSKATKQLMCLSVSRMQRHCCLELKYKINWLYLMIICGWWWNDMGIYYCELVQQNFTIFAKYGFFWQHGIVTSTTQFNLWHHARYWHCYFTFAGCSCTRKLAQRWSSLIQNNGEYRFLVTRYSRLRV